MAVTTTIATESKRPALTQTILDLYNGLHVGGAYDAKGQLVTDGSHDLLTDGLQEKKHTTAGFKTKMLEQASEYIQVNTGVETTRLLTSVYGHHSTVKYGARFGF